MSVILVILNMCWCGVRRLLVGLTIDCEPLKTAYFISKAWKKTRCTFSGQLSYVCYNDFPCNEDMILMENVL